MIEVWSDGRCVGIDISIGQLLLDPPMLGVPVVKPPVLTLQERMSRLRHAQRQQRYKRRMASRMYAGIREMAKADGVIWRGR